MYMVVAWIKEKGRYSILETKHLVDGTLRCAKISKLVGITTEVYWRKAKAQAKIMFVGKTLMYYNRQISNQLLTTNYFFRPR